MSDAPTTAAQPGPSIGARPIPLAPAPVDGWAGRRVLVTGGAGFVGSHLCDLLVASGAAVTALDDLSAGERANLELAIELGELGGERPGSLRFVQGTALDPELVDELVAGAEVVLHLAAVVGVRRVWEAPEATLRTNVRSTQLVMDAAVRHGARVLFTSSSEVYGKPPPGKLREDAPLFVGAQDSRRWSYAYSKACGEWLAAAHRRAHGLEAICVRLFNVVGPRQSARGGMVLPRFVRQACAGEALTVYGDGRQTRSFLHVSDATRALATLARPGGVPDGLFNVGGTREVDVATLAELVSRSVARAGEAVRIVRMPYREAYGVGFEEPQRRLPDVRRLVETIDFRPTRSLEQTVDELVDLQRAREALSSGNASPVRDVRV